MNPDLDLLQPYPFEKLNSLKNGIIPPNELQHIALSVGEPKHPAPKFVLDALVKSLATLEQYPATKGIPELRMAIADWATERFNLRAGTLDPEDHILPVNGTREALFAFAQAIVDRSKAPLVISPNPFYQIYEGATYLAGAEPYFTPCTTENGFIPDYDSIPADIWQRCQLLFICSPGNPTGAVMDVATLQKLIRLADQYDFVIAADECYSEIYFDNDQPPAGLLQACAAMGRDDFKRCMVFHSLSKRSNLPSLRSGFVAGDAEILQKFLLYRTYHGCAMPLPTQYASVTAWRDEEHVKLNRQVYSQKFSAVLKILDGVLDIEKPAASFYLWPKTPIAETEFTQRLFGDKNVTVLPGSYLSREVNGVNPGANRVRMALVAPLDQCIEAAKRIKAFVKSL